MRYKDRIAARDRDRSRDLADLNFGNSLCASASGSWGAHPAQIAADRSGRGLRILPRIGSERSTLTDLVDDLATVINICCYFLVYAER
jgi:hypothetical protein